VDGLASLDWNLVNNLAVCADDGLRERQNVIALSDLLVTSRRREEPEAGQALAQVTGTKDTSSDAPLASHTIQVREFVSCPELVECWVAGVRVDLVTELFLNLGVHGQRVQGHIEHDRGGFMARNP